MRWIVTLTLTSVVATCGGNASLLSDATASVEPSYAPGVLTRGEWPSASAAIAAPTESPLRYAVMQSVASPDDKADAIVIGYAQLVGRACTLVVRGPAGLRADDLCLLGYGTALQLLWSPDSRRLLIRQAAFGANGRVGLTQLVMYDRQVGSMDVFYDPRARPGHEGGPTYFVSVIGWSPDARFLAAYESDVVDSRGTELRQTLIVLGVDPVRVWRVGRVEEVDAIRWSGPSVLTYRVPTGAQHDWTPQAPQRR